MTGALKLAYHFRGHSIFEALGLILALVEVAKPVAVDFYFGLLHTVLENLVSNLRK